MIMEPDDEPRSNASLRWLIDQTFGAPSWAGAAVLSLCLVAIAALSAAVMYSFGRIGESGRADAASPLAWACIAIVTLITIALIVFQWLVRHHYRKMFGSSYHRR
jgi:hypothetical protein